MQQCSAPGSRSKLDNASPDWSVLIVGQAQEIRDRQSRTLPVGLITLRQPRELPPSRRATTRAADCPGSTVTFAPRSLGARVLE
jgi:hypothetical protein